MLVGEVLEEYGLLDGPVEKHDVADMLAHNKEARRRHCFIETTIRGRVEGVHHNRHDISGAVFHLPHGVAFIEGQETGSPVIFMDHKLRTQNIRLARSRIISKSVVVDNSPSIVESGGPFDLVNYKLNKDGNMLPLTQCAWDDEFVNELHELATKYDNPPCHMTGIHYRRNQSKLKRGAGLRLGSNLSSNSEEADSDWGEALDLNVDDEECQLKRVNDSLNQTVAEHRNEAMDR
ncbi:hypothetical protein Syun_023715 [Stephania yunnanensis]|uniref:Uncharacterized protein n=1 Tax=Stephania yunnanensis TaxID=152371 RepID=A0AAP0FA77_9MAGN